MTNPCEKCIHVITCEAYGGSCRRKEAYDRWKAKAAEISRKGRNHD